MHQTDPLDTEDFPTFSSDDEIDYIYFSPDISEEEYEYINGIIDELD